MLSGCGLVGEAEPVAGPVVEASVELLPASEEANVGDDQAGADAGATTPEENQAVPADGAQSATTAPAPTASPEATVQEVADPLSCLSNRARIAQLLLPLATQPELVQAQSFAASGELGGIGLLGQPDGGLADALGALQRSSFVPLMVASDEEGGTVQRLATLLGPISSTADTARLKSPEDTRREWVEYGSRVNSLGIDIVFGPVVDVGSGPGIASRSFGSDPALVASYGRAVAEGLIEAGITPVFKHFPGHGSASADSHLELPTTPSFETLRGVDLVPYSELLSDPVLRDQVAVMVGHLAVPGLSDNTPTSLSEATVDGLLRTELGFEGLVFTDALNMGAIVNTFGLEALELAILAGSDVLILGSLADVTPALDHLVAKVDSDPNFAAVVDNRAIRILASKGELSLCAGA